MTSWSRIDRDAEVPPYEQVRLGIIEKITAGELLVGSKLPTVRALAATMGLAVNTVARVYRELEADHFVETRGRQGTFIIADSGSATGAAQRLAVEYIAATRSLGIADEAAVAFVEKSVGL
ncbi:GntR family transcriptional regulator [Williamsia sterculiae]|uniref:GntR family transcriptional regulator n=1 Tax=Williamsia sterculiae TaxID=1344003 RepID=UPI001F25B44B|nr:GntR family transcriptional regulator [Williamsia sterculiae]